MNRVVDPEFLDELLPESAEAKRSRRDLERVNWFMGNVGILEKKLKTALITPPKTMVEIGAGDGKYMLCLARRLAPKWPNVELTLLDRKRAVSEETLQQIRALGWKASFLESEISEWIAQGQSCDLMVANLFLHHLKDGELAALFEKVATRTKVFAACEPRRVIYARASGRSLWLLGCSATTRHDAEVSIRAGFCAQELSDLWPEKNSWEMVEEESGLFSHSFVAQRKS